jgi:hypothetical protein
MTKMLSEVCLMMIQGFGKIHGWKGFTYSMGDETIKNRPFAYFPMDQLHVVNIGEEC